MSYICDNCRITFQDNPADSFNDKYYCKSCVKYMPSKTNNNTEEVKVNIEGVKGSGKSRWQVDFAKSIQSGGLSIGGGTGGLTVTYKGESVEVPKEIVAKNEDVLSKLAEDNPEMDYYWQCIDCKTYYEKEEKEVAKDCCDGKIAKANFKIADWPRDKTYICNTCEQDFYDEENNHLDALNCCNEDNIRIYTKEDEEKDLQEESNTQEELKKAKDRIQENYSYRSQSSGLFSGNIIASVIGIAVTMFLVVGVALPLVQGVTETISASNTTNSDFLKPMLNLLPVIVAIVPAAFVIRMFLGDGF